MTLAALGSIQQRSTCWFLLRARTGAAVVFGEEGRRMRIRNDRSIVPQTTSWCVGLSCVLLKSHQRSQRSNSRCLGLNSAAPLPSIVRRESLCSGAWKYTWSKQGTQGGKACTRWVVFPHGIQDSARAFSATLHRGFRFSTSYVEQTGRSFGEIREGCSRQKRRLALGKAGRCD